MSAPNLFRAAALSCLIAGCAPEGAADDAAPAPRCDDGADCASALVSSQVPRASYQQFALQTRTPLAETDRNFEFLVAENRDLFAIKKQTTGTRSTEVHVLSAASNYQRFSLQTGTSLPETGGETEFALASGRNLVAIKKQGTRSGKTELTVLSAASGYRQVIRQVATALPTNTSGFDFEIGRNDDLIAVKTIETESNKTEVHVLSAASNYQSFSEQVATNMPTVGPSLAFMANRENNDLVSIARYTAGPGNAFVQELHASDRYARSIATRSALEVGGDVFAYAMAPNLDIFAIKRYNTQSLTTEVHVLAR